MNHPRTILATAAALGMIAPASAVAQEVLEQSVETEYQEFRLVRVADGLEHPWAVAVLPDGRTLVTERPGRLLLIDGTSRTVVAGTPDVHTEGQGGLLDVVLHPGFASNGYVYITYSRAEADGAVTALGRARLEGTQLTGFTELFASNTPVDPGMHYGSRIVFLNDGTLLMTIGDRGQEERAQDTRDHSGTVLRLNADGSVPQDNPFIGNAAYAPEIYAYGIRNIQGMALHPITGDVWALDHGPRGSDLLHRIEPGRNYGWPEATRGRDYETQEPFTDATPAGPVAEPVHEFVATIAPSGLAIVRGGGWDDTWQGNLLAGGLRSQRTLRLVVENGELVHAEELLLQRIGRIRDVRQGPQGRIWIVTDEEDGGLYRLEPVN